MHRDLPPSFAIAPRGVWSALLDGSSDLMALLDAAGRVLWANPAFLRGCGRTAEQLQRLPLVQALQLDEQLPALAELVDRFGAPIDTDASPDAAPAELRLPALHWRTAGGEPRHGQARLQRLSPADTAGKLDAAPPAEAVPPPPTPAWLWVMQDTTELQQLQAAAAEARERLARAQTFGRIATYERELPLGRGHWDLQMYRLWGRDPSRGVPTVEEFVSQIHPDDRPGLDYRESARTPGQYSKRYRICRLEHQREGRYTGPWRHVHASWEVLPAANGQPGRIVGVMVDDTEVYQLAESFARAEHELNLAVDLGHIAIWRHDLELGRIFYNHKAFEVLDITPRPEGLTLAEVRDRIHPDDRQRVIDSAAESVQTDRPIDVEARYLRSDGSYRYVLLRRVVRRDAAGQPIEFVGVALDVSEQVAETRRAQELARRLEVAASAAGLGIWSRDSTRAHGEWNPHMFTLFGRDPAAGVPTRVQWLDQYVHPDDRGRMALGRRELLASQDTTIEHEYRIVRGDGEDRWLVSRAHHRRREGQSLLFGITMDVTERRRTEAALRQAHERIALAARGAGLGTWERDLRSDTLFWDDQMYRLRGVTARDGGPEQLAVQLCHPDDLPRIDRLRSEAQRTRQMASYEFRVRLPDGSWRWLASRSTPVFDAEGRMVRVIGMNWDVHERVMAEAERQEALIARRESQAKSEFLARMSHELRTPLNAMLGFAQLLQLDPAVGRGQAAAQLAHIQAAGEHLLALINDVLDLSGLASGQLRLNLQPVALAAALHEALTLMAPAARAAGIALHAEPTPARVLADPVRLRQVVLNLLSNAVKYNRAGGQVHLFAQAVPAGVQLSVQDNGRGMAADQLAHLFEPFNRLGVEREGIEGTGIGLSVVKALVEHMGGSVQARSTPGAGSCFEVLLPAAAEAPAVDAPAEHRATAAPAPSASVAATAPASTAPAPLHGGRAELHGRLLYIEDNAVNVLLLEEMVRSCTSLEIGSAPNGQEGIDRALRERPDLILVDMQLPDMHGFDVLRHLRARPDTAAIPCIALSANAMPEDIARARAAGFSDYWTKPIDLQRLLAALAERFGGR